MTKIAFDAYTMGFSNRTWDETVQILEAFEIERLVDIRTLPGSKHTPQFNLEHMKDALLVRGFRIAHIFSAAKAEEHKLTKFVKADGSRVTYPNLL